MLAAGINPPEEITPNAGLQRFHVPGDRAGSINGWYVLHLDDMPAGKFGTNRQHDVQHSWSAKLDRKLTEPERRALQKKWAQQHREREEARTRLHEEVAERAAQIWNDSPQPKDQPAHDYITRKQISPVGVRVSQNKVVVPARDIAGKLWTLQFIPPGGGKEAKFLTGGKKAGCFATLAAPGSALHTLLICEGYATGASLHLATGLPVAVAFDCGNLLAVAQALREKYQHARLILCADNDLHTEGNPGVTKAHAAARAVGGLIAIPRFAIHSADVSDFNDLHLREGSARVRTAVDSAAMPDEPEDPQRPAPPPLLELADPAADQAEDGDEAQMMLPVAVNWPVLTAKGKPLGCVENVRALLDHCKISVRYNVIKKDLDIVVPGEDYLVDTQRNDKMTRIVSLASVAQLPHARVEEFVQFVGGQQPYNPVVEWIRSKPWDGKSRLDEFYDTITTGHEGDPVRVALKQTLMLRWLVQAVAVAFSPRAISTYGVLVFQGDQHTGKTHWFNRLAPAELDVTKDGVTLEPDDKDSVLKVTSFWLVELGELDHTFKKSEISMLKAFVTSDRDVVRPPYARAANSYPRRTVFFGSVNDAQFLADPTGNRRFWTIPVARINAEHGIDMQQLWAEVLGLYQRGEPYYLTPPELAALNESNRDFELADPVEELMRSRYNWAAIAGFRDHTATEIADELGLKPARNADLRAISRAYRTITGKSYVWKDRRKVFTVPPLV